MKSSWPIKKIGEVCEVFADGDWIEKKDQSISGIRLIQTGNIGNGYFLDRSEKARYISEDTFKRLRCTEVLPGDCLLSRLPDPVGRAGLIPDTGQKMITAVDCTIMRFKKDTLPKWFIYYSLSPDYQKEINKEVTGATRQRISRSNLGNIEISVPLIPEQKRIVKILDDVFEKTARAKENAEKNLQNARELFESYLQSIFENPGDGWEVKRLEEVCEVIAGQSPKGKYYNKEGNGLPFYQGKKEFGEKFIGNPSTWTTNITKEALQGDVLMSVRAPVGPINFAKEKICIGRGLAAIRATALIDKEFLFYFFLKHEKEIIGNTGAVFNSITKTQIENILVPFPPLFEQSAIILKLDALSSETKKLEAIYQQKLNDLEELKKSILKKAFNGELVGGCL